MITHDFEGFLRRRIDCVSTSFICSAASYPILQFGKCATTKPSGSQLDFNQSVLQQSSHVRDKVEWQ